MKKIISIICVVALLLTSMGLSLYTAVATTAIDVTVAEKVTASESAVLVQDTSPLPLTSLYKTNGTTTLNFEKESANNAGVMFYVETPDTDDSLKLSIYLWSDTHATWMARYSSETVAPGCQWYYYDSEVESWAPTAVNEYGTMLPPGYKGYVYISIASLAGLSDGSKAFTTADSISKAYITSTGGVLIFSAPMFVSGTFGKDMPTLKEAVIEDTEYSLALQDLTNNDTVIMPTFIDTDGSAFYPSSSSVVDLPSTVVSRGTITTAENNSGLPMTSLFSVQQDSRLNFNGMRGKGALMYVEVPDVGEGNVYRFGFYLVMTDIETGTRNVYRAHPTHYNSTKYSAIGSGTWLSAYNANPGNYGFDLPSGFKGYVYVPFSTLPSVGSSTTSSAADMLTGIWFTSGACDAVPPGQKLVVSAPMVVKGDFDLSNPSLNHIVVDGKKYALDGTGLIKESGIADDPDYVKPSFTAVSLPKASEFNVAINQPTEHVVGENTTTIGIATETLSKKLSPISGYPSVAANNVKSYMNSSYYMNASKHVYGQYNFSNTTYFDAFLIYVDVSENTDTTKPAHLNMQIAASENGGGWACKINGTKAATETGTYSYSKSPAVYLLRDDGQEGTQWEKLELPIANPPANYSAEEGVILPTGFKGYIYVPYYVFRFNHQGRSQPIKNLMVALTSFSDSTSFKYYMSAPVVFKKDFGFDPEANPTKTIIDVPSAIVNLDTNERVYAGIDSYSKPETYDGKADIAVDSSLIPSVKPLTLATNFGTYVDHPLNQRSSAEYYGTGKLWNGLAVGSSAFKIDNVYSADVTTVFTDCMIDNLPAFRVDANADLPGDRQYYQFIPASSKLTVEKDSGVMFYIKNESAESKYFRVVLTTPKSTTDTTQDNTFNSVNVGNSRLLAKGETSWEKVSAHENGEQYINIEAGFEGYIFVDFESKALMSTLLGSENAYISGIAIYSDLNKDDSFTISTPLLVENFADDYNEPLAIVNGAEAAQNLLTGNFEVPFDTNGNMKLDILDLVYSQKNSLDNTLLKKNYYSLRFYKNYEEVDFTPLTAGKVRDLYPNIVGDVAGRANDVLLFDNPDRGYRTTLPVIIRAEHEVGGEVTDTCDLVKVSINQYGKEVYEINTESACYRNHDVETSYANLDVDSKKKQLGYMINNVYFLNTSKTDYAPKLQLLQLNLPDCRDTDAEGDEKSLPANVIETIQLIVDEMREREIRILFRIGYHMENDYNLTDNKYNDGLSDAELEDIRKRAYVSKEQMLMHIEDLAAFFGKETVNGKNIEVINKMSSGFIGSGGEMTSNYQWPTLDTNDYNDIIKKVIDKICEPFGLYFTVRSQKYKEAFVEQYSEDQYPEYKNLIGTNNDAVFGEQEILGHHSGCYQVNHNFLDGANCSEGASHTPNSWWENVTAEAAYTPQSGEMYHEVQDKGGPSGYDVIKEMAHHRFVTLSQWNGYEQYAGVTKEGDLTYLPDNTIQRWINNEIINKQWLDDNGIIYDPAWFIDEYGQEITDRNPYEFMRDHLGYRLVAQNFSVKGATIAGRTVHLNLNLKNYGFAAAFGLESSFVILDEEGKIVSSAKAGNPDEWISLPADYYTQERNSSVQNDVCEYTIEADIVLPEDSGTYRIALLLENAMHDTARLSNATYGSYYYTGDNTADKNGYNVFMTFSI